MASWSEKYLKLSPKARRNRENKKNKLKNKPPRFKKKVKPKRKYTKVIRRKNVKKYTREQMIEWGRINGIRVVRDLWKMAFIQEDTPTFKMILKEFGSWGKYKELVGNVFVDEEKTGFIGDKTEQEYARLCLRFNIFKRADYLRVRKQYSNILISYEKLMQRFGSWYNFRRLLKCFDTQRIITEYVEASIEAGHPLKLYECDEKGIEIRRAMEGLGKRIFNRLLRKKQTQIYAEALRKG